MDSIRIRRLSSNDSLVALKDMLHRAFAPLGRRGVNCTCVDQSVETTRRRTALGACLVAVLDDQVVGTLTLQGPDRVSPVLRYRDASVGSIHQFAVDPCHQGAGIGRALLRTAERWATNERYRELALDTPEPALHLRTYYGRRGFSQVETVQLEGKSYRSVVLSKAIVLPSSRQDAHPWPARHPAEMAAMALASASQRRHRAAPAPSRHEHAGTPR